MSYYKHRRIDLAPVRQADGTWHCSYIIFEFRQTCWGCQTGSLDGSFSSRKEATLAAMKEAKHVADSLERFAPPPKRSSRSRLTSAHRTRPTSQRPHPEDLCL